MVIDLALIRIVMSYDKPMVHTFNEVSMNVRINILYVHFNE